MRVNEKKARFMTIFNDTAVTLTVQGTPGTLLRIDYRRMIKMRARMLMPVVIAGLICGSALAATQYGVWGGRLIVQNDPPPTELVVVRLRYGNNGNIGGMGWAHNYPDAEVNLNQFTARTTSINVKPESFRIMELGDEELFRYPFAFISEPGEMDLTRREVANFREYIERGGFIVVDDFDGEWQLRNFLNQLTVVFPDRTLERLQITRSSTRTTRSNP